MHSKRGLISPRAWRTDDQAGSGSSGDATKPEDSAAQQNPGTARDIGSAATSEAVATEQAPSFIRRCGTWIREHRPHMGGVFALLCIVGLFLPSSYVVESPGPTMNVLGTVEGTDVIKVSGATVHKDNGKLLMTTVNASGLPQSPALVGEVIWAWFSPKASVMPREVVYPSNETGEEYEKESKQQMVGAQSSATQQALAFLKEKGVDTTGITLSMDGGDVGGPSAGLMYTLGSIDKLTAESETGGKVIAGTGTIDSKGKVGAIGGIRLKMIAAKRDGASWFLAPADNCSEVIGNIPDGLTVVKATTLDDAYKSLVAIGKGETSGLPACKAR